MKQTEIGLIPDDWEVKSLGDVCSFNNGVAHENYVDDNGEFILVNSKFISSDAKIIKYSKKQLFKVEENTILMVMSDVPNGKAIAKCFLVPPKFKGTLNQRICMFSEFKTDKEFTYRIINRNPYYLAFDDGIKQTNLRKQDVLNCPIAFPPTLAEQQRIAKTLSDVDVLISTTEKLLQKKKNIKQGTMQNLLTGKKRLPGFGPQTKSPTYKQTELGLIPEDWEVMSLGEICDLINGDRSSKYPKDEEMVSVGIPFINAGHLKGGTVDFNEMDYITRSHYESLSGAKIQKGDILFCLRGSLGKNALVDFDEGAPASSLCVIRNKKIDEKLLFQIINSKLFEKQIIDANSGSSQPNLSAKDASSFLIPISQKKEEQNAIANVLSSMDKEIESLNTKLEKYRQLKTAMMQQLLTGKIRL